jgi:hypothetical protein
MFSKGEVVWAKLKGFPWWPAIVNTTPKFYANFLEKIQGFENIG